MEQVIPLFSETKKFRTKKLKYSSEKIYTINKKLKDIKSNYSNNYYTFI